CQDGVSFRRWKVARGRSVAAGEHCRQRVRGQSQSNRGARLSEYYGFSFCELARGTVARSARSILQRHSCMSNSTYDVVIVGAGIVGAACAYECVQRGMRVAVVDRDVVGGGATGAAMGHIVVMDDSDAQFALTRYSQTLWHELRPELPPEVEYEQCGTIWVAADEIEMSEVLRKRTYYARNSVPVEVLSSSELERLEPNLRKGMAGGLLVPEDGVLYPPCATRFLLD